MPATALALKVRAPCGESGQSEERPDGLAVASGEAGADDPRTSVWTVASVDQPVGDGSTTLRDVIVSPIDEGDPEGELDRSLIRELLGDLSEEKVANMSDAERDEVRVRLEKADLRPSISRATATAHASEWSGPS